MTKEEILINAIGSEGYINAYCVDCYTGQVYDAMDQYAKQQALAFIDYNDKFRVEESRWFNIECKKAGGVFSLADYGVENIYNDFIAKKPIRSYLIPDQETYWVFDKEGKLIHSVEINTAKSTENKCQR